MFVLIFAVVLFTLGIYDDDMRMKIKDNFVVNTLYVKFYYLENEKKFFILVFFLLLINNIFFFPFFTIITLMTACIISDDIVRCFVYQFMVTEMVSILSYIFFKNGFN